MSLVVLTGGARSGKSSCAQRLAGDRMMAVGGRVRVVVFGRDDGTDPEFGERIARHRAARPAGFDTAEVGATHDLERELRGDDVVLIDCIGTLLGLVMEECFTSSPLGDAPADTLPRGYGEQVSARFSALVEDVLARAGDTVIVTNEVGDGLVPTHATGRLFRDLLGRANRRMVGRADGAYLCVAGRLLDLLQLPAEVTWPND